MLVVVLGLLIFGFKSCRDNARENALRDYNTSVGAIARQSDDSVSKALFAALQADNAQPAALQKQVQGYRDAAAKQAGQARDLDVPDAMDGAQRALLLALDLRTQAIGAVATRIPAALGSTDTATAADTAIADQMRSLLTSDVIYSQRVAPLIKEALTDNGISGQRIPVSKFLPDLGWLNADTVAARLGGGGSTSGGGSTADAADTTVAVFNGTQTAGLARSTADKLAAQGYGIGTIGDAPAQHTTSVIAYASGRRAAARAIAGILGLPTSTVVAIDPATTTLGGSAQVVVTAGSDLG